ncbi:MAG: hypothetical protein M1481_07005 [Candidatus Thermoplasmatota archaeon]|nr:hypothetical protein [Candidatus Thermoplasmatota archaeon]MCL5963231.1 hypothetical protein [Candidatus Thermoplasmatota archaeon]
MDKTLIIGGSGLLGSKLIELFEDAYVTYNNGCSKQFSLLNMYKFY